MPLNTEISGALQLLEHIQQTINDSEDVKLQAQTSDDLNLLISLLDNPIFHSVATIQDSLNELSYQIQKHPSILPVDFDLTAGGELVLKLPSPVYDEDGLIHPRSPATLNASVGTHRPPSTTRLSPVPRDWDARDDDERSVMTVKIFKPDERSLGFSIVSLRSMEKGEIGIFIQEIQPQGIAGKDGRLKKGDQILSIDGQPVGSNISHQQAISLLQKARGNVELIVARSNLPTSPPPSPSPSPTGISDVSDTGEEMAFNTEWGQVEVIDLLNDGCGLGFGITGDGRTGVVVKTLLPGGVADRDGRLKSGDHILQIGDVYLQGMGSEQVVEVLRQAGSRVRLVVNRPIEVNGNQTTPQLPLRNHEYIEPDEGLDLNDSVCVLHESPPGMTTSHSSHSMYQEDFEIEEVVEDPVCEIQKIDIPTPPRKQSIPTPPRKQSIPTPPRKQSMNDLFFIESHEPEMERFTVELKKDLRGLGITIAGYVCEKEELSGIFVKNISAGSVADTCKKIQVNDRIVEVDGQSLHGFTNHEAVEVLRSTGGTVRLTLERYLRGPKFQELQQAIANSELKPNTPPSPSTISLPCFPSGNGETPEPENPPLPMSFSALIPQIHTMSVEDDDVELLIDTDYEGVLKPTVEEAIKKKWWKVMGPDVDIVVGQLRKVNGGGLGISLEGTIDTENSKEIQRHHYIRSILPDGPVGKNGKLKSGDELLEVNGHRLFGMSHIEVVNILKELPLGVRMVCARHRDITPIQMLERYQPEITLQVNSGLLEGNLQNLMPVTDRLVKAKSDGCLASTATSEPNLGKHRSKSLEPIAGLAMWSSEPHIIELVKGEHGLGFSILDYQDPLNPNETVIVIRSLVPGGVAQADGRLIPGDRLLAVNTVVLDNASLDQAVQALKGAPKGIVRIVVAKPLPITETAP